jgi:bifunctional ADP-heptose synthase (sugar kinase/adenylyltransferase)
MKILLIGESCKDVYHYGNVNRLSPEAPVAILDFKRKEIKDGMSLNVKNNLESLFKCSVDHITQDAVIEKHRFVDERTGQQLLRCDYEKDIDKCKINADPYIDKNYNIFQDYDCVVISDYDKGFISAAHMDAICDRADVPVFIDTKKSKFGLEQKNVFVKINESEYENLDLQSKYNFNIIVTLGERGCRFNGTTYDGYPVDVFDVCGAGDVFLAAFVYAYMKQPDLLVRKLSSFTKEIFNFANKCAAESVKHRGTYVVTAHPQS